MRGSASLISLPSLAAARPREGGAGGWAPPFRLASGEGAGTVDEVPCYNTDFNNFPISAGLRVTLIPHASITASFSCAVPLPPEMIAPA